MKVGIVGTRWGRTHVGTFRAAGCAIHAIVGRDPDRSREVARAEGVPYHEVGALDDVDIVVVATPLEAHLDWIRRFPGRWTWCEKPLGGPATAEELARVGVNYAWPHLAARGVPIDRVRVAAGAGGRWACREVAVHPLSWLHHHRGPVALDAVEQDGGIVVAWMRAGDRPFELRVEPSSAGIDIDLGDAQQARLRAGWSFDPPGAWYDANCAAAASFVGWVRGGPPPPFHGARALELERAIAALWD